MVRSLLDVPSACPPKLGIKTENRALGRIGKRKVSALEDSCGQRRATTREITPLRPGASGNGEVAGSGRGVSLEIDLPRRWLPEYGIVRS